MRLFNFSNMWVLFFLNVLYLLFYYVFLTVSRKIKSIYLNFLIPKSQIQINYDDGWWYFPGFFFVYRCTYITGYNNDWIKCTFIFIASLHNFMLKLQSWPFSYMYLQPFKIFEFFHKIIFNIDIIKRKVWFSFLSTLYLLSKLPLL